MVRASRDHLNEVQETYFEHFGAALAIAALLVQAGIACAMHAVIPGLCTRTASRYIAKLSHRLSQRVPPEQAYSVPPPTTIVIS